MDCDGMCGLYIVDDWQQAFHLHYIKIISCNFFFVCYVTDITHALFIVINTSIIIHTDSI